MKRKVQLVSWSFPLFVAITAAGIAGLARQGIEVSVFDSAGGGSDRPIQALVPVLTLPEIEWDSSVELDWDAIDATAFRIRARLLSEINDDFQDSIDEEYRKLLESSELGQGERSVPLRRQSQR